MFSVKLRLVAAMALALLSAMGLADAPAVTDARAPARVEGVLLATHSAHGIVQVQSWKARRDARIVKQDLDYSCGAASLATLLNSFYGQSVTEDVLLKAMDKSNGRASFEDMAQVLPQFGFRAQGFAASWEQLMRLKMPVILYVKHRKDDHFTVLRGINSDTVWLADPSLGNRTYSRAQFLAMWLTREDRNDGLAGKFLAVLPTAVESVSSEDFFTKTPYRQSASAALQLAFRGLP